MFKKQKPAPRRRPSIQTPAHRPTANTPSVFSYHASRSAAKENVGRGKQEEERPIKARKPRTSWVKHTVRVIVFLTASALLVSNFLIANVPKVLVVGSDDAQFFLQDTKVYQDAAKRIFTASILNSNKLTVDVEDIRMQLKAEFPELADVSLALPLIGRQPVLYIEPSTSRILLKTNQGNSFVLDGSGRAIMTGNHAASLRKISLPEVVDESGIVVSVGSMVLPRENVTFITEVVRQLKAKNLTISVMTLPAGNNELHVRLQDLPYFIKFNLQGDAREETGAFLATKEYTESQKKAVNEYIDVRIDNRVYYR